MASPKISKDRWLASLKQFLREEPGMVTACLVILACIYYVSWGGLTLSRSSVSFGFIALGAKYIWDDRKNLSCAKDYPEERFIGYTLAALGSTLFFFFHASASFQYLSFALALTGFALLLWGANFFVNHVLACFLIAIGLYPNLIFVIGSLWRFATPPLILENFMGNLGGQALNVIGQSAIVEGRFISIGSGTVEVNTSCSGFEMAVSTASVGLLMGLFFKQPWLKISLAVVLGIVMALAINVPRIMLLAYIVGYYDKSVFDFWHGPWGGQIFMAILFTLYYYLAMAFFESNKSDKKA